MPIPLQYQYMHGTESGKSLQLKMGKVDEKEARNKKEARNRAPVPDTNLSTY